VKIFAINNKNTRNSNARKTLRSPASDALSRRKLGFLKKLSDPSTHYL